MNAISTNCMNCGTPVTGKYCSNCGEKIYTDHDKSIGHIFHEGFHFLTHLDGKLLTSMRSLIMRPGELAYDFCRGVRKKYFKPVSLFFVVVIIYLIFPFTQGLNLSMESTMDFFDSRGISWVKHAAAAKATHEHISMEQLAEHYDHKSPAFAKIMLVLLLPMAASILWALFYRKRRLFFDHFILATELVTSFILITFLLIPMLLILVGKSIQLFNGGSFYFGEGWLGALMVVTLVPLWTLAIKRFYREKTGRSIYKAVLFITLFTLLCLFIIYRLIIFFTILLFL